MSPSLSQAPSDPQSAQATPSAHFWSQNSPAASSTSSHDLRIDLPNDDDEEEDNDVGGGGGDDDDDASAVPANDAPVREDVAFSSASEAFTTVATSATTKERDDNDLVAKPLSSRLKDYNKQNNNNNNNNGGNNYHDNDVENDVTKKLCGDGVRAFVSDSNDNKNKNNNNSKGKCNSKNNNIKANTSTNTTINNNNNNRNTAVPPTLGNTLTTFAPACNKNNNNINPNNNNKNKNGDISSATNNLAACAGSKMLK